MKNRTGIILIIVFAVVFLVTSVLFKVFGISGILAQFTGTLLGTIITAIVTVLLLGVQTNKEISHDRDVGVFEKKQEVYHKFIEALESITQDGKVNIPSEDNSDKTDELQHLIYQLGFVQMHASKGLAEEITRCVGDLLSTLSLMQNGSSQKRNELYSQLAEYVFKIVSLLKDDLYNSQKKGKVTDDMFKPVSKSEFNSAIRATGAFDDELLSENERVDTLTNFLENLTICLHETTKKQVSQCYRLEDKNDSNWIARNYLAFKTDRWAQIKVSLSDDMTLAFEFDPNGWINVKFCTDFSLKRENVEFEKRYNALSPKDQAINFIEISDNGYKFFARLSDDGKKLFVQNYVSNILTKIETVTSQEESSENMESQAL